jgi:hypothetical protein
MQELAENESLWPGRVRVDLDVCVFCCRGIVALLWGECEDWFLESFYARLCY